MTKQKQGKGERKSSPRKVSATFKQSKAIELRISGWKLEDIAKEIGWADASVAYNSIMAGLKKMLQEPAEELRKMEAERLDFMWHKLFQRLTAEGIMPLKGLVQIVDSLLRVQARRARLFGLDAPYEVTIDWREKLKEEGISDSEIFEKMVAHFMEELEKAKVSEAESLAGSETEELTDPENG